MSENGGDVDQFEAGLAALGITAAAFGRHIGVHRNTVSKWSTGKARVPKVVFLYLDLLRANRAMGAVIDAWRSEK